MQRLDGIYNHPIKVKMDRYEQFWVTVKSRLKKKKMESRRG